MGSYPRGLVQIRKKVNTEVVRKLAAKPVNVCFIFIVNKQKLVLSLLWQ